MCAPKALEYIKTPAAGELVPLVKRKISKDVIDVPIAQIIEMNAIINIF